MSVHSSEEHTQACILCSDKGEKKVVDSFPLNDLIHIYKDRFPGYDFQNEFNNCSGNVELLRCGHCDLLYFFPQIAGSDKFYEYLQQFDWYYSTDKAEFGYAKKHITPENHVLEIGSGSGFFARNLDCASYTGLEFNDESIRNAAKNGITLLKEFVEDHATKNSGKYDIVCAFQVLEHVTKPGDFLKASIAALKPGGKLIIAIPSADSYSAYFPNHHLNLPPHHITMWTDKNFHRMADVFGLNLKHIYHEECDSDQIKLHLYALSIQAFNKRSGRTNRMIELSFLSKVKQYIANKIALFLASGISNQQAFSARGQSVTVVYKKDSKTKLNYLNIGCGNRFHPSWLNIDIVSYDPSVITCNILKGLPYPDNQFDVIYHSHVLEHFSQRDGKTFIKECFRVLKPGGVIRIAIPDLEKITRTYIQKLDGASNGNAQDAIDYQWIMLELYDQTIRNSSGGEMKSYLEQELIPNEQFIYNQIGAEARIFRNHLVSQKKRNDLKWKVKNVVKQLKDSLMFVPFFKYYVIGKFRSSGEIHYWMYDRYSLSELLNETGFINVNKQQVDTSSIHDWSSFELDASNGLTHKPDSLFMEATKP